MHNILFYTRAFSISVSAFTFCIGRRYSALMHPNEGCSPIVSVGLGRLFLSFLYSIPFQRLTRKR